MSRVQDLRFRSRGLGRQVEVLTLRVQVPNNHILTQNLYYNYYYPNPKYQNIGYLGGNLGFETCGWLGGLQAYRDRKMEK